MSGQKALLVVLRYEKSFIKTTQYKSKCYFEEIRCKDLNIMFYTKQGVLHVQTSTKIASSETGRSYDGLMVTKAN